MSGVTITIDNVMMNVINSYMAEKKYSLAKPFYDGVSKSHVEGMFVLTQQSINAILNMLAAETIVELYLKLAPVPQEIAAKEAANKAAAEAAAEDAARGRRSAPQTDANEDNIMQSPDESSTSRDVDSRPHIEEVKE